MTQARITLNGTEGSNLDLPINTVVTLGNTGNGGEASYLWSIVDQPTGTADVLSSTTVLNPTLAPKKEGDYLLQLIVNQGLADEQRNRVIAGVKFLKTRINVPAAGETTESGARGHAAKVNQILGMVDAVRADPGIMVVQLGATVSAGTVLRFTSSVVLKNGLPGQETVPVMNTALATQSYITTEELAVALAAVDGGSLSTGKLVFVRVFGLLKGLTIASAVAGDAAYVSDTGTVARVAGTNTRRIGKIVSVADGLSDVYFRG